MSIFRPWGQVGWLLDRLGDRPWSLLACCGSERRSIALATYLTRKPLGNVSIVAIRDPDPLDGLALEARLTTRAEELAGAGFAGEEIHRAELLTGLDNIRGYVSALADAGTKRLLLDITSLPKMWFFPMVQAALEDRRFEDVVATYTSATDYADQLSENITPLRVLPGFYAEEGRSRHDLLIVGIGFEPLGLVPLLSDQVSNKIRLIFPFPPGPPGHRRNWMFVKQIEELTQSDQIDPPDRVHIHMYDCPQVFDALCDMTENGHRTAGIAPYGPKTVSLAMCLFSLAATAAGRTRVPVYYAQPQRYALDYTTDVRMRGGVPDTTGYCLRLAGRDLYTLTTIQ
jgi:hypothetical protein